MDKRRGIGSFVGTMGLTLASAAWLVCYTLRPVALLAVMIAVGLLWFLPWDRWPFVRLGLQGAAGLGCLYAGLRAVGRSLPEQPLWLWLIGWGLLLGVLLYCGQRALMAAGRLLGLLAAALLLLFSLATVSFWQEMPALSFGPWWQAAGAAIVLLGCMLTGRELSSHFSAARLGGLAGLLLWGFAGATPLFVWSERALRVLSMALPATWQRVQLLSLLYCPDVLLCSLTGLLCLWQNAACAGILKSVLYKRRSL